MGWGKPVGQARNDTHKLDAEPQVGSHARLTAHPPWSRAPPPHPPTCPPTPACTQAHLHHERLERLLPRHLHQLAQPLSRQLAQLG